MKTKPFRDKRGRFAKRPAKFKLAAPKAVKLQKQAGRSVVTAVDPVKRAITVDTHWLITVTAVQLDAFWNRLSLPEKARIVESLL